jgi:hypothetical protein
MENLGNVPRFHRMICGRKEVIDKWNLNLLAALVLSGSGQRPQVYAQLELPQASELQRLSEDCCRNKLCFSLRAGREKTTCSVNLPTVLFPRKILEFIGFHVLTMRPILVNKILGPSLASPPSQRHAQNNAGQITTIACPAAASLASTLLIHTKDGRAHTSSDVKRTLTRFLERVDPELAGITPMAIRGTYASMMLQARRRKKIFRDMNEQTFLEFLAKQMNTSVEQLATTYASCDVDGFEEVANEMMKMLSRGRDIEVDNAESDPEADQRTLDPSPAELLWN